jgi:endonuclease-3
VDTHVKRIAGRLGLTEHTDPVRIERDLTPLFPRDAWGDVNHRLVWFGRDVCMARKPRCAECELLDLCPRKGVPGKDPLRP